MANKNGNRYQLDFGVDVVFKNENELIDHASKRATQLEALIALLVNIDTEAQPRSLMTDVLWLARDLADEMKAAIPVIYKQSVQHNPAPADIEAATY